MNDEITLHAHTKNQQRRLYKRRAADAVRFRGDENSRGVVNSIACEEGIHASSGECPDVKAHLSVKTDGYFRGTQ